MLFYPKGIWSICTRMNVRNEDWAPLVSFRLPSIVTGAKAAVKASAQPSSVTLPSVHRLFCPPPSYKCPICRCPLNAVCTSPRCLTSRKVTTQTTVFKSNSRIVRHVLQEEVEFHFLSCNFLHVYLYLVKCKLAKLCFYYVISSWLYHFSINTITRPYW